MGNESMSQPDPSKQQGIPAKDNMMHDDHKGHEEPQAHDGDKKDAPKADTPSK